VTKIIFVEHDGTRRTVEAADGRSVMQVAVENHVRGIIGDCGGCCSCGTCHGYVDAEWIDKLKPPANDESMMLEGVIAPQPNSRLTCQIEINPDLDGLLIRLPAPEF